MTKFMSRFATVAFMSVLGACGVEGEPAVTQEPLATERKAVATSDERSPLAQNSIKGSVEEDVSTKELEQPADENFNATYTCTAATTCTNGVRISCYSTGAACRASYVSRRSVLCEAWSASGVYVYSSRRC